MSPKIEFKKVLQEQIQSLEERISIINESITECHDKIKQKKQEKIDCMDAIEVLKKTLNSNKD